MERYVLVFDVCSSTSIIEDLVSNEQPQYFSRLLSVLQEFLQTKNSQYDYEVYKFMGDGYILLFTASTSMDMILEFYIQLVGYISSVLEWFVHDYLAATELPRLGISAGLDFGSLHEFNDEHSSNTEYFGKAINLATRFQSSQERPDNVNRLLFSSKLYLKINEYLLRVACTERTRTLKNINKGEPIRCYEFNPLIYENLSVVETRTEKMRDFIENEKDKVNRLQSLLVDSRHGASRFRSKYGRS
jgi:class 3 adenylate cyclase